MVNNKGVIMKVVIALMLTVLISGCGKAGPTGATGPQGVQGPEGAQGPAGLSPTIVQLCSACITHYPDTFAEIAFCYNGSLYGTYSANGGFSSELPAGAYNSNGINCSCTVTIGANCVVTD